MMHKRTFVRLDDVKPENFKFTLTTDRQGKAAIHMTSEEHRDIAFVSPACVTHWPRCTGDGNFGTMWGPTDISKAKFSLDLTDSEINNNENLEFKSMADTLEHIDNKLLDFVYNNQLKVLGRKNLNKDECKMLQIRTVRPKYDKVNGYLSGHSVQLSTPKFTWDGMGGKYARTVNICDHTGAVLPNATIAPGDVVAATMYAAQVYTGVGGDKFGIQWSFDDVSVVCQRSKLEVKAQVTAFSSNSYDFAMRYEDDSFSDPITVQ